MSEYDDIEDRRHENPQGTVRASHWGPWVWIVPAIAIFFVGYLIVRYGFFGGGDITVRFVEARCTGSSCCACRTVATAVHYVFTPSRPVA